MSKFIRENFPMAKLIMGGSISAASEIMLQNACIDVVVHGEGEIAIKELASSLNGGKGLTEVKGISFRDDQNKIIRTEEREQIKNIDDISYPAYDLLDMEHYLVDPFEYIKGFIKSGYDDVDPRFYDEHRRDKKMMVVHTARGCTHRCTFCQRHMKGIRLNSLEYLFDYIEFLIKKYNVGFFSLGAELFLPSKKYYWEFIEGMKERNLDILFYVCGARVNTVDKNILQALKELGCWMIEYGFESGSQKMLDIMEKGTSVEQNIQVALWTKDAGIFTVPAIILGMPGETTETVRDSINFLKKIDIGWHQFSINYPLALPGSALYDYARLKGYITNEDEYLESVSDTNASMLVRRSEKEDCFVNYTDQPDEVVKSWQNLLKDEMERHYIKNKMKGNYALKFLRVFILYYLRKIPGILQREGFIGGLKYLFGRLMGRLRVTLKKQNMKVEKEGEKTNLIPVRKEQDGNGRVITRSVSLRKVIKSMATEKEVDISNLD
jgi:radical SAM superfamily enzyme YgiQ (UPF0313 family)